MAQPVLMDFTAVRNASKRYGELADDCKSVYDELQKIGQEFMQSAAMGAVGGMAAKIVTDVLRVIMNMRRKKFKDIQGYLLESYVARREGDEVAAPEFDSGTEL